MIFDVELVKLIELVKLVELVWFVVLMGDIGASAIVKLSTTNAALVPIPETHI